MRDTDFSIIVNCSSMHRRNRERERRKKIVSPIFLSFLFFYKQEKREGRRTVGDYNSSFYLFPDRNNESKKSLSVEQYMSDDS